MSRLNWILGLALAASLTMVLAGCGGPGVSRKNYEKVAEGMTLEEVEAVLGKDYRQAEIGMAPSGGTMDVPGLAGVKPGAKVYLWQEGDDVIYVVFVRDRVANKSRGMP